MKEEQVIEIVKLINEVTQIAIMHTDKPFEDFQQTISSENAIGKVKQQVEKLCKDYPLDI